MRDLRRNSGRGEFENSHGDVFHNRRPAPRVSEICGGSDPRLFDLKRGSMFGSGSFRLNGLGLSGVFHRIDIQADATGRLHHRRAPRSDRRVLYLSEGRKRLSEELVAKGDDLFLAHRGQCHRLLCEAELFAKDFEQPRLS